MRLALQLNFLPALYNCEKDFHKKNCEEMPLGKCDINTLILEIDCSD